MSDLAIRVEGLGKRYRIGQREPYRALRDVLMGALSMPARRLAKRLRPRSPARDQPSAEAIWALQAVSFDVRRTEAFGIIGPNGAGKTTLLKILSRITEPTEGRATLYGRVGALLEVGTGFHPELTGRENVSLNGAILGMRRTEIARRFDEIVGFAGVEKFIDTPVKYYSSGMYMRLAFAVAAHLHTEILFVDEVLAVGDAAFQLKCLNKMSEVSGSGKTVLFVSHNLDAVTKLCARAMLLDEGRLVRIGTPQECVDQYLSTAREPRGRDGEVVSLRHHPGRTKPHNGPVRLTALQVLDESGSPTDRVPCGGSLTVVVGYELIAGASSQRTMFTVSVANAYHHWITACRSHDTYREPIDVTGSGKVACRIVRLPLVPGIYRLTVGCATEAGFSDGVYHATSIEVIGNGFYPSGLVPQKGQGDVLFEHQWEVLNAEAAA